MRTHGFFELHTPLGDTAASGLSDSATRDERSTHDGAAGEYHVLRIPNDGLPFRVAVDPDGQQLTRAAGGGPAIAEFHAVSRRTSAALAMVSTGREVLVNGLPALRMTVVQPQDTLTLLPGTPTFVTLRVIPYVGRPTSELLGQRCPSCKIPLTPETHVVRHRCGLAYHHETETTHPNVPDDDRLRCFEKLRVCLSCSHPMTLEESLTWDPPSV